MIKFPAQTYSSKPLKAGVVTKCTLAFSMALLVPAPIMAQESGALEEVLVTASKRSSGVSQHDLGSAVSVLGADTLNATGIVDIDAMASLVPGLNIESFGPGDSEYIIRGINSAGESTVSVYFDESPITGRFVEDGGGKNAPLKLVDIDRIEVLKGPQGTLFGANSMGGVIRIITNKPNLETFEGRVDTELGFTARSSDQNYDVNGMLNIPLVENTLGLRLVAYSDSTAGFIDNNQIGVRDANDVERNGVRTQVLFQPSDVFSLNASVTYQELESGHNPRVTPAGFFGPGGAFFINEGSENPRSAAPGGKFTNTEFSRTAWDEELLLASITGEYDIGKGVITAAASYFDREIQRHQDSTPLNTTSLRDFFTGLLGFDVPPASVVQQPQDREVASLELRYASRFNGPLQTVVGGSFQHEENLFENFVINANSDGLPVENFIPEAPTSVTGAGEPGEINSIFGRFLDGERERVAVFGELSYEVSPALEVTGGLRWFRFDIQENQGNTGPDFLAGGGALELDGDETTSTYKLNVTWRPNDDYTYYAEVATGFRPGGTNVASGTAAIAGGFVPPTFESDELRNHEIGAKLYLLERRLNLNLAAYWIEWDDIQVQTVAEGGFNFIDNAGKARVLGLEAEGSLHISDPLTLSFGFNYTNAELTEDQPFVVGGDGISFTGQDGDDIPKTPKFVANLGLVYDFVLGGWDSTARLDYFHKGDSNSDFSSRDALLGLPNPDFHKLPSIDRFDVNISFQKDNLTLGLFVRNLTDEDLIVDVVSSDQDPFAYIMGSPRTVGLRLGAEF
ncbi:TonB-dependent receptor [Kineobactrum salinum]|nr:TonB-dependent receptor [Kineobactrum salinum]